jgi:hypothetical protein
VVREVTASTEDKEIALPLAKYTVKFITGDRRHAGTNANVFFTLYGKNGDTSELKVEHKGGFDRASEVSFDIDAVWLDVLTKARVGHDNRYVGWLISFILLLNPTQLNNKKNLFFIA